MKDTESIAVSGALFDGRYKLLRPLSSEGGTADVWLALDTNTIDEIYDEEDDRIKTQEDSGIKVAIKIYRPKNALDLGEQRFREEFKIVFNCHHTNLVQPINFSIYEGVPYLVLPFCQNGSSESLEGKIEDKDELWKYIADVSAGLTYLHSFSPTIVHHDIKPANILIDDNRNYAITDFGISSHRGLNKEGYDDTQSGTMAYMAPERFRDDYESVPESDIWSFGATLYELVTGKVPFGENGGLEQLEKNLPVPPIEQAIPKDIKNLIADCLSLDASKRPSADYINKAASARQYPPKKSHWKFYLTALIGGLLLAGIAALIFIKSPVEEPPKRVLPSDEELYSRALSLVNRNNTDSLTAGLGLLDSLGAHGYIPAIYEQAFTYGWYSDSASVARKKLLGIELYPYDPENPDQQFLPVEHHLNNKTIGLLTRIEEAGDPAYPDINANALYRLASYYVNPNKVFQRNEARAKSLLTQARRWAVQCGDSVLVNRIDRGLNQL